MTRAQTVMYNHHQQQVYQQPYNYAQQYAMDPYRAPSVVSSFMASPFSHNPFLPPVEPQSTQSSPSHQPVGLPYGGKRFGGPRMGTKGSRRRRMMEEYRPESTVPNDTASEAETEAKRVPEAETEFETETEMEEVWLEESDDDELENEFHPTYFVNPAKRKRRFEQKWEQMVKLFREIDRETDATMILAAAPPDQHQTHLLLSRSILRDTNFSHIAQEARSVFSDITVARRHQRSETLRRARQERQRKKASDERLSAVAHLTLATQGGADNVGSGSDETSVPTQQTDQDLRMALDAARVSLQEMRRVYDEMETRHREESNRRKEESLTLEKLLTPATMFFIKELTHRILLHPSYFGPRMTQYLETKLYADVEGTCSGRFGYIIAVLGIVDVGKGMVMSGTGQAEFVTKYRAIVFKPFKGEVVDGVVTNVNKMGFFAEVGPLQVFVSSHLIHPDMKFDPNSNPPSFASDDQIIDKGTHVRLKIVGTRVDATEIVGLCRDFAIGTIKEDSLGVID
ncbi:unnamed protein product [Rhizoctonia solani]|nr:unnamed protein product [Rhizoctonia solani]